MADAEDIARFRAGESDLSQSDFRNADLSNADFRGRHLQGSKFEHAQLLGANFEGCDLTNTHLHNSSAIGANFSYAIMPRPIVAANFSSAILVGANFENNIFAGCLFQKADLRGANFRRSKFQDDNNLSDAIFDDDTDFEGAEVLRPLSRLPIFRNYSFNRGVLSRNHAQEIATDAATYLNLDNRESTLTIQNLPENSSEQATRIKTILSSRSTSTRDMSASLAIAVDEHINLLAGNKPNDPEQLARFDSYVALLRMISEGLWTIASSLNEVKEQNNAHEAPLERAAGLISELSRSIRTWFLANNQQVVGNVINGGMIGACSVFFTSCGASPSLAFPTAAALIGGKTLTEAAGSMLRSFKGDKGKE